MTIEHFIDSPPSDFSILPSLYYRYYSIAGLTLNLESDSAITDETFNTKFKKFQVDLPTADIITIRHIFSMCTPLIDDTWQLVYKKDPWAIYKRGNCWIYLGISGDEKRPDFWTAGIFDESHSRGIIYHRDNTSFLNGNNQSLTLFPTDQILLARVLADRQACYVHAAGMILHGQGILFVGHSEAGKSTTVSMLKDEGEILCDDRIIVRHWPYGFKIHGTWSHGDIPDVSNSSAPLRAIFFLEQSQENSIEPLDKKAVIRMLPFYVIKPLVTADWWEKILDLVHLISQEVPVYRLKLDRSGKVRDLLDEFLCTDPGKQ
ncbi:MAG: hypothetical protein BWY93_00715 [Euryarchaeota archaeon ADurb.BinA087]|nr:MAG: hypothetical protein BWY93_00715 [Euryarchaeota archaeon ADurb.BinA087]